MDQKTDMKQQAPRTEREIEEREAKTWVDDRHLDANAGEAVVDDTHLTTPLNAGAPANNIIGHGSIQGQDRGSAQIGGRGHGSQVGSEFDTSDED